MKKFKNWTKHVSHFTLKSILSVNLRFQVSTTHMCKTSTQILLVGAPTVLKNCFTIKTKFIFDWRGTLSVIFQCLEHHKQNYIHPLCIGVEEKSQRQISWTNCMITSKGKYMEYYHLIKYYHKSGY